MLFYIMLNVGRLMLDVGFILLWTVIIYKSSYKNKSYIQNFKIDYIICFLCLSILLVSYLSSSGEIWFLAKLFDEALVFLEPLTARPSSSTPIRKPLPMVFAIFVLRVCSNFLRSVVIRRNKDKISIST